MFAVIMVTNDGGSQDISHVATCKTMEDARHFIDTCLGDEAVGGIFEVGTEEWVHPTFADLAQPSGEEG